MVSPLARIEADTLPSDVSDTARSMWRDTAVQEAMFGNVTALVFMVSLSEYGSSSEGVIFFLPLAFYS